ncbi:uracil-DNA glycosylase [Paraburkholderia sp. C35]|uniref:uracil-DNA glycosylase n=1 Tax=Paraburkholderia sp. C35 TaxID=2126993 RepID=UPI000D6996E2|nr:uracil-DNA glycosylase [Paraburkholderia sp. C35]
MALDAPRTLRSLDAVVLRRAMLTEQHIAPLAAYVADLRVRHPDWEFQDFDPLDGGVEADMLFLLEKPGPMTSTTGKKQGSGFISRNNDDPTAENLFNFMSTAGIERKRTVLWNVIPGWNATIKYNAAEIRRGVEELRNLLPLLPNLRTVVLVGKPAQRANRLLQTVRPDLRIHTSAHPSAQCYRFNPDQWRAIPGQWQTAGQAGGAPV